MKKYIIWSFVFVFLLSSCSDVLDIEPTNMISEEDVKKDPALVNAFLTKIYANVRWQTGAPTENMGTLGVVGGEHNVFAAWQTPYPAAMHVMNENGAHASLEYWPFANIRSANEIIEILKEATFDADLVAKKTAEARFLRSFMYFEMVKRYGGVALITVPQSIDQPVAELFVPRNSEKEVYDFIAKEMDEIAAILPSTYGTADFGRASKWAALALKSRAMLYAASIAQYGTVQLDGLLGIPKSEATAYYTKSYEAAMEIISNSPHVLYKGNADPAKNYGEIFTKDGNSEVIFAEVYNLALLKAHTWNHYCMPEGFNAGWGSNYPVYWEFAEKYEYIDGSAGKVDPVKINGKTLNDINDLMHKKDPRFRASVFYPETPWQGKVVHFHTSTVGFDPAGTWPQMGSNRNRQKGLLIRKRVDETKLLPIFASDETDWIVFRTGEMYMNAAEAALHLDNEPEARRLVNLIRERAGMPAKTLVTFPLIQNERAVELAFEEHRYWDLRRWRIAAAELNGKGFRIPQWVYNYPEKKYTVTLKTGEYGSTRSFTERNYYFPIGLSRLADNPNLVENPGYIK